MFGSPARSAPSSDRCSDRLLLAVDFAVTALAAAGVFVVVLVAFVRVMPREPAPHRGEPLAAGWRTVLRDRTFLAFAAAYASWLLAYNQLYLALPVALGRLDATAALGPLFALAAALVVVGQMPIAAWTRAVSVSPAPCPAASS